MPRSRHTSTPVLLAVLLTAAVCLSGAAADAADRAPRPNIVLMLADDQGWDGLSVEMAPAAAGSKSDICQTPHLAALARQGMRFSNAYAPAPVCSPTRISLQTGRSPAALHWTKAAPPEEGHRLLEPRLIKEIADGETTIGGLLRQAGYATAHFGKWHIGGGGPARHGYDESDGDTGNEHASRFTDPNPVDIFGMAERAEDFMARCHREGRPFFIQLSWNALHAPENALQSTLARYQERLGRADDKRAARAALTEDLDTGVGRVLAAIDRLGLGDTTFVIYTSDNGSGGGGGKGGRAGGLSGGKGSVREGGIRVPFILRGPGVATDSWCHEPIVGYDLFPTFCEWAGVPRSTLPATLEGASFAGLAAAGGRGQILRPQEGLLFHFPHYQSGHAPHSAIRVGGLKLILLYEDSTVSLFDLDADPGERVDLASRRPADAARLRTLLESRLASVQAQLPTANPRFDPASAPTPKRGVGGKKGGPARPDRSDS